MVQHQRFSPFVQECRRFALAAPMVSIGLMVGCGGTATSLHAPSTNDGGGSSTGSSSGSSGDDVGSGSSGSQGGSGAQGSGSGDDGGSSGSVQADGSTGSVDAGPSATPFPTVTDFAGNGPFMTTMEAGGSSCTIFRPTTLGQNGLKHPVIIWGNGTAVAVSSYSPVLTHWASHGFIVAAANTEQSGTGKEMLACLDWVTMENATSGSIYAGNVDLDHVGASGHSQGGGGTLMAGRDVRVTATAPLEPYTQQGFGGFDQASESKQHGPMFLMSGGSDNIAVPSQNQAPVFQASNVPTFWGTLAGANHVPDGEGDISGFRGPATAWLRYFLMNDQTAKPMFYGAQCGLCTNATWTVQRKELQ